MKKHVPQEWHWVADRLSAGDPDRYKICDKAGVDVLTAGVDMSDDPYLDIEPADADLMILAPLMYTLIDGLSDLTATCGGTGGPESACGAEAFRKVVNEELHAYFEYVKKVTGKETGIDRSDNDAEASKA